MARDSHRPVVVAAGQLQSRLMNEADATLEAIESLITEASRHQADLLVLPECAYPAYLLGSAESYRSGTHLGSSQFVNWLSQQASRRQMHIVSGFVEDNGERLYNAAILIGPDGRTIGQARKRFLWHVDQDWFTPGEEIRAFDTSLGRIGIIICAEARIPEIIATLAADGAELLAMPTCWINGSRQPGSYYNPQSEYLIATRAREFGLPFVCADKCGLEMTTGYVGQSCIAKADGSVPVKAPAVGESLVVSTLQLRRASRSWVNEARRARLLEPVPAQLSAPTEPRPTTIAAVSTALANARLSGPMGEGLFKPLQAQNVELLVTSLPHEVQAGQISMYARAFDMHALAFPTRSDLFDFGPARAGSMAGQWVRSFTTGRALALEGAEMLMYFDAADESMLRTRALENRVFVVAADSSASIIIGPDGEILARGDAENAAITTVDLAQASDKLVAPRTDIFAQRRPDMYRL